MELKMKLARKFNPLERQKIAIVVLAGCFVASLTFVALPKPRSAPSPTLSLPLSLHAALTTTSSHQQALGDTPRCDTEDEISNHCKHEEVLKRKDDSSMNSLDSSSREDETVTMQLDTKSKMEKLSTSDSGLQKKSSSTIANLNGKDSGLPKNSSSTIIDSNGKEKTYDSNKLDAVIENPIMESKSLCDVSNRRADLCEMTGDIRILDNSTITSFSPSNTHTTQPKNSWKIRPYARKGDDNALSYVHEILVTSSSEAPKCTHRHDVPAIVFSVKGYAGNIFHDFTDIIIPLFLTARQFNREVQFLVSDINIWWIHKYQLVLQNLSRYPIIDLDKLDAVHCFPNVIVGLRCHKELSIDPKRAPNGYSMVNFTQFMRTSLSLERDTPTRTGKKPRLLIIPRKRTRALLNVDEITKTAEELGYEVVVAEPVISSDIAKLAQVVNSCDVMMGVHGAGLTNLVYLPTTAVLIQIVPWGGLEWISMLDFGSPAKDMELKYLQYSISAEESTLIDLYPRDHPVIKDPFSFHNRGWNLLRDTYMDTQNVRLDVRRFSPVLQQALDMLR